MVNELRETITVLPAGSYTEVNGASVQLTEDVFVVVCENFLNNVQEYACKVRKQMLMPKGDRNEFPSMHTRRVWSNRECV